MRTSLLIKYSQLRCSLFLNRITRPFSTAYAYNLYYQSQPIHFLTQKIATPYICNIRTKKKKAQMVEEDGDEGDKELEDFEDDPGKDYKDIVVNSFNLRTDNVLKMSNNISKKKVDDYFLEGKIYLNGKLLQKKAYEVNPNDEIDIVIGTNTENPEDLVNVNRVFILMIKGEKNKIGQYILHVRRFNSLAIPKYQQINLSPLES